MTELKPRDLVVTIGVALVLVGAVFGLALQSNLWSGPTGSTIISDTVDPDINEAASTHGSLMITDEAPTLLCFVTENMEMRGVTATVKEYRNIIYGWTTVETIDMSYVSKNGDIYKYRAQVTEDLEANKNYRVVYKATDAAGRSDEATVELRLVELDGTVWVNGIEITSIDQTIYLQTHTLAIEAEINQDTEDIQSVRVMLNGEQVDVLEYRYSSKDYFTSYQLPRDGDYDLIVQVLAVGGAEIRLASFHVGLNSGMNPMLLAGAVIALVAIAGVMYYLQQRKEA